MTKSVDGLLLQRLGDLGERDGHVAARPRVELRAAAGPHRQAALAVELALVDPAGLPEPFVAQRGQRRLRESDVTPWLYPVLAAAWARQSHRLTVICHFYSEVSV